MKMPPMVGVACLGVQTRHFGRRAFDRLSKAALEPRDPPRPAHDGQHEADQGCQPGAQRDLVEAVQIAQARPCGQQAFEKIEQHPSGPKCEPARANRNSPRAPEVFPEAPERRGCAARGAQS